MPWASSWASAWTVVPPGLLTFSRITAGCSPVCSIAVAPVTAIALSGILVTAALFLLALQRVFTGPTQGQSPGFADLHGRELWSIGPLLALSLLIGVLPQVLLGVIEPASAALVDLVGR